MATINNVSILSLRMCQAKMIPDILVAQDLRANLCLRGLHPGCSLVQVPGLAYRNIHEEALTVTCRPVQAQVSESDNTEELHSEFPPQVRASNCLQSKPHQMPRREKPHVRRTTYVVSTSSLMCSSGLNKGGARGSYEPKEHCFGQITLILCHRLTF